MFASLQQQHQRARPPRPHRGETAWQDMDATVFPRRAAEELQPSAFSLQQTRLEFDCPLRQVEWCGPQPWSWAGLAPGTSRLVSSVFSPRETIMSRLEKGEHYSETYGAARRVRLMMAGVVDWLNKDSLAASEPAVTCHHSSLHHPSLCACATTTL